MVGELREKPIAECPLCLKKENPKHQDLICGNCVHDQIEIIRNSVIENERANNILRNDINAVFTACETIRSKKMAPDDFVKLRRAMSPDPTPDVIFNEVSKPHLPVPSMSAVKHLALQLQKLDTVNTRSKLAGIQNTNDTMAMKVASLEEKVKLLREQIAKKQQLILEKKEGFAESYMRRSDALELETFRIRGNGMKFVVKQAMDLQLRNYLVLKEVAFPNFDKWKVASGSRKPGKTKLELFAQPIILLSSFLSNNKLESINTFLENLIYLQIILHHLLTVNNVPLELPYLDTLRQLLPDSNFFDLVQKKFSFIIDDPRTIEESNGSTTPVSELDPMERPVELAKDGSDKIVIKDKVIHIPISFRTVNLQRRLSLKSSLKSPEKETFNFDNEKVLANEANEDTRLTNTPSPKSKPMITKSILKGKQIVIVPHKILTKPFTRLLSTEYLRFILVIVKIIMNFQILLKNTIDKVPENKIGKHASGNSLTNTINQLRFSGGLLSSVILVNEHDKESSLCDFKTILAKIADMESYFKYMEEEQLRHLERERSSRTNSLAGLTLLTSTARSALTQDVEDYIEQENSVFEPKSSQLKEKKVSRMRGFYDNLFGKGNQKRSNVSSPVLATDQNIYGLVSETYLDNGESNNSENYGGSENNNESTSKNSDLDPRAIMTMVHQLIAQGNGGSRAQSLTSAGNDAIKLATLSMLEESRHQLDDWDVLSRMY